MQPGARRAGVYDHTLRYYTHSPMHHFLKDPTILVQSPKTLQQHWTFLLEHPTMRIQSINQRIQFGTNHPFWAIQFNPLFPIPGPGVAPPAPADDKFDPYRGIILPLESAQTNVNQPIDQLKEQKGELQPSEYENIPFIIALILSNIQSDVILMWLKQLLKVIQISRQSGDFDWENSHSQRDPFPEIVTDLEPDFNTLLHLLIANPLYHHDCLPYWVSQYVLFTGKPTQSTVYIQEPHLNYISSKLIDLAIRIHTSPSLNDPQILAKLPPKTFDDDLIKFSPHFDNGGENNVSEESTHNNDVKVNNDGVDDKNENNPLTSPELISPCLDRNSPLLYPIRPYGLIDDQSHNGEDHPVEINRVPSYHSYITETILSTFYSLLSNLDHSSLSLTTFKLPPLPKLPDEITVEYTSSSARLEEVGQIITAAQKQQSRNLYDDQQSTELTKLVPPSIENPPFLLVPLMGTAWGSISPSKSVVQVYQSNSQRLHADFFSYLFPDLAKNAYYFLSIQKRAQFTNQDIIKLLGLEQDRVVDQDTGDKNNGNTTPISIRSNLPYHHPFNQDLFPSHLDNDPALCGINFQRDMTTKRMQTLLYGVAATTQNKTTQRSLFLHFPTIFNQNDPSWKIPRPPLSLYTLRQQQLTVKLPALLWAHRSGYLSTTTLSKQYQDRIALAWPGSRYNPINGYSILEDHIHQTALDATGQGPMRYLLLFLIHYINSRPILSYLPFSIYLATILLPDITQSTNSAAGLETLANKAFYEELCANLLSLYSRAQVQEVPKQRPTLANPMTALNQTPYNKLTPQITPISHSPTKIQLDSPIKMLTMHNVLWFFWSYYLDFATMTKAPNNSDQYLILIHMLLIQFTQLDYWLEAFPRVNPFQNDQSQTQNSSDPTDNSSDPIDNTNNSYFKTPTLSKDGFFDNFSLVEFATNVGLPVQALPTGARSNTKHNQRTQEWKRVSFFEPTCLLYNPLKPYYQHLYPTITDIDIITGISFVYTHNETIVDSTSPGGVRKCQETVTVSPSSLNSMYLNFELESLVVPLFTLFSDFLQRNELFYPEVVVTFDKLPPVVYLGEKNTRLLQFLSKTDPQLQKDGQETPVEKECEQFTDSLKQSKKTLISYNKFLPQRFRTIPNPSPCAWWYENTTTNDPVTARTIQPIKLSKELYPIGLFQYLLSRLDFSTDPSLWNLVKICQNEFFPLLPHLSSKPRLLFSTLIMRDYPQIILQNLISRLGPPENYLFVPVDQCLVQTLLADNTTEDDRWSDPYRAYHRLFVNSSHSHDGIGNGDKSVGGKCTKINPLQQAIEQIQTQHSINLGKFSHIWSTAAQYTTEFNTTYMNPSRLDGYGLNMIDYCIYFNTYLTKQNLFCDIINRTNCSPILNLATSSDLDAISISNTSPINKYLSKPELWTARFNLEGVQDDFTTVPNDYSQGQISILNSFTATKRKYSLPPSYWEHDSDSMKTIGSTILPIILRRRHDYSSHKLTPHTPTIFKHFEQFQSHSTHYDSFTHKFMINHGSTIEFESVLKSYLELARKEKYDSFQVFSFVFSSLQECTSYDLTLSTLEQEQSKFSDVMNQFKAQIDQDHSFDSANLIEQFCQNTYKTNPKPSQLIQQLALQHCLLFPPVDQQNIEHAWCQHYSKNLADYHIPPPPQSEPPQSLTSSATATTSSMPVEPPLPASIPVGIDKLSIISHSVVSNLPNLSKNDTNPNIHHLENTAKNRLLYSMSVPAIYLPTSISETSSTLSSTPVVGQSESTTLLLEQMFMDRLDYIVNCIKNQHYDQAGGANITIPCLKNVHSDDKNGSNTECSSNSVPKQHQFPQTISNDGPVVIPPQFSSKMFRLRAFYQYYYQYYDTASAKPLKSDLKDDDCLAEEKSLRQSLFAIFKGDQKPDDHNSLSGSQTDKADDTREDAPIHTGDIETKISVEEFIDEAITRDYITWAYCLNLVKYQNLSFLYKNQQFICQILFEFIARFYSSRNDTIWVGEACLSGNHEGNPLTFDPTLTNINLKLNSLDLLQAIYTLIDNNYPPSLLKPLIQLVPKEHIGLLYKFYDPNSKNSTQTLTTHMAHIKRPNEFTLDIAQNIHQLSIPHQKSTLNYKSSPDVANSHPTTSEIVDQTLEKSPNTLPQSTQSIIAMVTSVPRAPISSFRAFKLLQREDDCPYWQLVPKYSDPAKTTPFLIRQAEAKPAAKKKVQTSKNRIETLQNRILCTETVVGSVSMRPLYDFSPTFTNTYQSLYTKPTLPLSLDQVQHVLSIESPITNSESDSITDNLNDDLISTSPVEKKKKTGWLRKIKDTILGKPAPAKGEELASDAQQITTDLKKTQFDEKFFTDRDQINRQQLLHLLQDIDPSFALHSAPSHIIDTLGLPKEDTPSVIILPEEAHQHYDPRYHINWINMLHNPFSSAISPICTSYGIDVNTTDEVISTHNYVKSAISTYNTSISNYDKPPPDHQNPDLMFHKNEQLYFDNYSYYQQFLNQITILAKLNDTIFTTPMDQSTKNENDLSPTIIDLILHRPHYIGYLSLLNDYAHLQSHIDFAIKSPSIHHIGTSYGLELINKIHSEWYNYNTIFQAKNAPEIPPFFNFEPNSYSPISSYDDISLYTRSVALIDMVYESMGIRDTRSATNITSIPASASTTPLLTTHVQANLPSNPLISLSLFNHSFFSSALHGYYTFPILTSHPKNSLTYGPLSLPPPCRTTTPNPTNFNSPNKNSNLQRFFTILSTTFSQSPTSLFIIDYQYPFSLPAATALFLFTSTFMQQFRQRARTKFPIIQELEQLQQKYRTLPLTISGRHNTCIKPDNINNTIQSTTDSIQFPTQKTNCNIIDVILVEFYSVYLLTEFIKITAYNYLPVSNQIKKTQAIIDTEAGTLALQDLETIRRPSHTTLPKIDFITFDLIQPLLPPPHYTIPSTLNLGLTFKDLLQQAGEASGLIPHPSLMPYSPPSRYRPDPPDFKWPVFSPLSFYYTDPFIETNMIFGSIPNPCLFTLFNQWAIPVEQQVDELIGPLVQWLRDHGIEMAVH